MGVKLSLCMIVKDEQDVLARCLASAAELADEIVIADTGSRDNTKEIAKSFTDKVFDFAWEDDFSAARNFSFSKATGDYVMWLDADDVIEESDLKGFLALKAALETERPIYFRAGQYVTLGCPIGGSVVSRPYALSSALGVVRAVIIFMLTLVQFALDKRRDA